MSHDDPGLPGALADADFLVVLGPVSRSMVQAAPRLKFIQVQAAGYEGVDLQAAAARGIPVATVGGAGAASVAEHAVVLILSLFRRLPVADAAIRDGQWPQIQYFDEGVVRELAGATVGLVGFGHIGQAVGRIVRGFGAQVVYYRRTRLIEERERECGVRYLAFDDLLRTSDAVSVQVPLTDQTRGLIDARALGLMKPTAVLINVSRGDVMDEAALVDALASGRIGGAGLDVFHTEPLPPDSALRRLPNVVLTPHIGGAAVQAIERIFDAVFINLRRVAAGQPPLWPVERAED
ncbi:MAG: lactate dehydrogenase [Armatimonadetes bacterium]|nr:lactate dehydrogenase [Armatimonadota bacterium]